MSVAASNPTPNYPPELKLDDQSILARTIWGEARGEDRRGREMVAASVMNRVNIDLGNDGKPDWWGEGVVAVCLKPFQFDCWLPGDPNRKKLLAVTEADPVYAECLEIAAAAVAGTLPDYSNGATHYLNPTAVLRAAGKLPRWAIPANQTAVHGRHNFYRVLG